MGKRVIGEVRGIFTGYHNLPEWYDVACWPVAKTAKLSQDMVAVGENVTIIVQNSIMIIIQEIAINL